ncbi:hypothetical protein [Microbispora bryophytorum]|uniref:hypothetical protein n=1 Tax=Microbispora bryophytorum TaxID=1460882 RepID=UPI0033D2AF49
MDDLVARIRAGLEWDEEYARHPAFWKEYVRGHPSDPKRVLREAAAKRRLLENLLAEEHVRVHGDEWFSCAQARDEDGEFACANDLSAGGPCDCGRDERVRRRLEVMAEPYGDAESR